jgi:hypothetical protein
MLPFIQHSQARFQSARYPSFYIGCQVTEFVEKLTRLGLIISNDWDDADDI